MLPVTFQGLKCAAPLPAKGAPSIRSVKLVHLLININSDCDKTSFGGGRKGPCPEKLTVWRLGQTTPPVIGEERTGIHAHHLMFS